MKLTTKPLAKKLGNELYTVCSFCRYFTPKYTLPNLFVLIRMPVL